MTTLYTFIYESIMNGKKAELKAACNGLDIKAKAKDSKADLFVKLSGYLDKALLNEAEAFKAEAEAKAKAEAKAEKAKAKAEKKYLAKTEKGFVLTYSMKAFRDVIIDGTESKQVYDKPVSVKFTCPKQVFQDRTKQYAEAVAFYYFNAKEALENAKAEAFEKAEREGVNIYQENSSKFAMISSLFAESTADELAKAQGLYLAGSVLPVIVGGMKDSLETLHKAFQGLNIEALKGKSVKYTAEQVNNMNKFRDTMKGTLDPFTDKTVNHHPVKFGVNEADLFSWLCWCTGQFGKFSLSKPRLEKLLIEFFMAKVKVAEMPKVKK